MTKQPLPALDVERLLSEARWVEGFARALVREDSDDVAQDAWLAAIQHPPAATASPRPWFATVMRNLGRMRFRSTSRRRAREEASAPGEQPATPAELAHRMELQRRLATAVLALDDPQRSTVVLVFYEGLSPADVARQQGVPATTVRSRLRAALVTLRERLDAEEGGDRRRWHLALGPIAAPKLAPASGPLWLHAFAGLALLIVVVVGGTIAVQRSTPRAEPESRPAIAMPSPSRQPAPMSPPARSASTPTITTTTTAADDPQRSVGPAIPPAFASAEKTLMAHVDECYEIANRGGHDLKGVVQLTIALEPTQLGLDATVQIDPHTTIADPDFLECIRENARAIEAQLESVQDQGPLTVHVSREMPPTPEATELVQVSPTDDDDTSPSCSEGAALTGTQGVHQWCVLPDGTKHGPEWFWDKQGTVIARTTYDHGASSMEMQNRPRE